MKDEYSTLDIVKALGIPRERLRDWMNRGFVKPSIQEAKGQGTKALFSRNDVYRIALYERLIRHGYTREVASAISLVGACDDHNLVDSSLLFVGYHDPSDVAEWEKWQWAADGMSVSRKPKRIDPHRVDRNPAFIASDIYYKGERINELMEEERVDYLVIIKFTKIKDKVNAALATLAT